MPQVTMWRARDGKLFETESECQGYEEMLAAESEVETYLASKTFANAAQSSKTRNAILDFLRWRAEGNLPETLSESEAA